MDYEKMVKAMNATASGARLFVVTKENSKYSYIVTLYDSMPEIKCQSPISVENFVAHVLLSSPDRDTEDGAVSIILSFLQYRRGRNGMGIHLICSNPIVTDDFVLRGGIPYSQKIEDAVSRLKKKSINELAKIADKIEELPVDYYNLFISVEGIFGGLTVEELHRIARTYFKISDYHAIVYDGIKLDDYLEKRFGLIGVSAIIPNKVLKTFLKNYKGKYVVI